MPEGSMIRGGSSPDRRCTEPTRTRMECGRRCSRRRRNDRRISRQPEGRFTSRPLVALGARVRDRLAMRSLTGAAVALALFPFTTALAQQAGARVIGVVRDSANHPMPGVDVVAIPG